MKVNFVKNKLIKRVIFSIDKNIFDEGFLNITLDAYNHDNIILPI